MRTLVLVRHGETTGNSSIRYFGRTDVELSAQGRAQMYAVRRWLRSNRGSAPGAPPGIWRFAPVISSPLRRAAEGARIIAGAERSIVVIEEFAEVDFGRFEGLTAREIRARYPVDFERWNRDRLDPAFTYPAGESRAAFGNRVAGGIQRMLELVDPAAQTAHTSAAAEAVRITETEYVNEVALVVAHRGVIRIIAERLAGVSPDIELGSIHIFQREDHASRWRAASIDNVEHLAGVA